MTVKNKRLKKPLYPRPFEQNGAPNFSVSCFSLIVPPKDGTRSGKGQQREILKKRKDEYDIGAV